MLVCLLNNFCCDLVVGIVFVVLGLFIEICLEVGKVYVSCRSVLPYGSPCWSNDSEESASVLHYAE